MTDFAGYLLPVPETFQQELTGSLDDGLERFQGYVGEDIGFVYELWGTHTRGTYDALNQSYDGYLIPTYADDLFGHIILVPERLDLGNLLSLQTRTIEISNLNLVPVTWDDISHTLGDGIVFNNLPTLPHEILPFGSFELSISISPTGPPTIDGLIQFEFSTPETIIVPVTGSRIVMFQWKPRTGVQETLSWRTDIIEAYDGTEQRIRVRTTPRQVIRFSAMTKAIRDSRMRMLLFDWEARIWGVPIWWEMRTLPTPAIQGSNSITVDTSNMDIRIGGLIMLHIDDDTWEALQVEDFGANLIETGSGLTRNYPAGTALMPVRSAYMTTMVDRERQQVGRDTGLTTTAVEFTTLENRDWANTIGAEIYAGKVVLSDCNVVPDTITETFERPVVVIDNESGRPLQTSRVDRSRIHFSQTFNAPNMAELWRIRRLIHSFYGSQKSFWVPSARADLNLTDPIGPGTTEFNITRIGYTEFVRTRRPLADVRFVLKNGTKINRRIASSFIHGDGVRETLVTTTPINPTAIPMNQVQRIELLMLMRNADDKATFVYREVGKAFITLALKSVKE